MHLLDKLSFGVSRLPELAGIEKVERKRVIKSCRWKFLRHWQNWAAWVAIFFFFLILVDVIEIWRYNLEIKKFNQILMSFLALLSVFLFLALLYILNKINAYFMAPYIVMAMADRPDISNIQVEHAHHQQLRKKAIKRGVWIFVPCFLIVGVCTVIAMWNPLFTPSKMPEELNSPRVVMGMKGLTKKVFLEDVRLGQVTDIVFRNDSSGTSGEAVYVGSKGALFISKGLPNRFVKFDKRHDHVNYIQLNSRGVYGFMNRGAWCGDARVMDETGRVLWSYSTGGIGIDDMASGDLDGDGNPEYAVGFNGGGGVHLLDGQGKKLWEFPDGNVWHVEIADLYGNGRKMIVHSNAGGEITVRDRQGKIISNSKPDPYFSDFALIRWPDAGGPERLLLAEDDAVWILDADAKTLAKFPAPYSGSLGDARGALISINAGKRALATIVDYYNWGRSILYLHDLSGNLLYQEILPESCQSIAVLPSGEARSKGFVVGGDGKIIEYRVQ